MSYIKYPTVPAAKHPARVMNALTWHGKEDMRVSTVPCPAITDPTDVVIRVTSTTVCGSDLHMYHHEVTGMEKGDILGHEFMGVIEEVGPSVRDMKIGDRVVVSAVIACGSCHYCKKQQFSLCDTTNPSSMMEPVYGQRIAGVFGYSHMTGGFEGGQAEYVRIPYGDFNCLKIPAHLRDEQVLFLSDIACTGWHANELAEVTRGETVVVWGCGPVGLMAQMWAKFRGASRVVGIDCVPERLNKAQLLGSEIIDFSKVEVVKALKELFPYGPDKCIDAAGFRFPGRSLVHTLERAVKLESDAATVLNEAIIAIRKGGVIGVVGDYFQSTNHFKIGALMEKGLTMRGSQVFVHKYWKELLSYIESGKVDPTFVITHTLPLKRGDEAYRAFDKKEDGAIKIILKPSIQGL